MEMSNILSKEFKTLVIKMLKIFKKRDELNKETNNRKNNQSEMKNTITIFKDIVEGIKIRLDEVEDQISNL